MFKHLLMRFISLNSTSNNTSIEHIECLTEMGKNRLKSFLFCVKLTILSFLLKMMKVFLKSLFLKFNGPTHRQVSRRCNLRNIEFRVFSKWNFYSNHFTHFAKSLLHLDNKLIKFRMRKKT
jgi:hypothetical protein